MADFDTIGAALSYGATRLDGSPTARRDAELLLIHALGLDRAYLLTHPEARLTSKQTATYEELVARRVRHEPIQYISGEQEFFGLKSRARRPSIWSKRRWHAWNAKLQHASPTSVLAQG
jgi:methylase of polypeptide subunit release factors